MKILSNKKYKEMSETINNLKENYSVLTEKAFEMDYEIKRLENENCILNKKKKKHEEKIEDNEIKIADYVAKINELKTEIKSLKSAKGGYARQVSKIKAELEETQKKLEESMTDKYLVKKVPMGKLPKGQVMKMKSHAKQDKIIQKIYEKMEKDEI